MTDNLRRSLHDLSQSEREHLAPLSVDLLQRRAHRSRVLRRTAQTAAGAGTAAAVVVGGMAGAAALRDRGPQPAPVATAPGPSASPTASPTPTRTPTPTPTPTAPAFQPRWEDCGETVWDDSLWTIEDDGTQWVLQTPSYRERDVTTRSSLDLELAAMSESGGQESVTVRILDAVALQYDQESFTYTVAGVAGAPLTATAAGDLAVSVLAGQMPAGLPLPTIDLTLTSCDAAPATGGDGSLEAPLTGDWYDILVTAEVIRAAGEVLTVHSVVSGMGEVPYHEEPTIPSGTPPATTARDPIQLLLNAPVRLGTDATRNNVSEGRDNDPALATWCGADAAAMGLGTGVSTEGTPATVTGTAFLSDTKELILQMTTTNTGPTLTNSQVQFPDVWVVKDGRVVGKAYDPSPTAYKAPTWPTGSTVQLEMSIGQFTCTFMYGEYWPAGTYQLYASHGLSVPGTASSAGRVDMVHSGPLSFTLP